MATVSVTSDLEWDLASISLTGQTEYKKETELNILGNWSFTDKLNDLKKFEFTVINEEFNKANINLERDITIPGITNFVGMITAKEPQKDSIKFTAHEKAWHLKRRKFTCHSLKRITYTKDDWFDALWKFRRIIKTNPKKISIGDTGLEDVVLPFQITDEELKQHALSDGRDILFVIKNSDGVLVKMDHEIETYIQSTGKLVGWIRFPEIRNEANIEFYMYFGNPDATSQASTATWTNAGYAGVWHLHNDSLDSTVNNNDGTDNNITRVTGKMGDAARFNAVDSNIRVGSDDTTDDIFTPLIPGGGSPTTYRVASAAHDTNSTGFHNAVYTFNFKGLVEGDSITGVALDVVTASGDGRSKVYDVNDAGFPDVLLGESGAVTLTTGDFNVPLTTPVVIPENGEVYAGVEVQNSAANISYSNLGDVTRAGVTHTFGVGPDPFGTATIAISPPYINLTIDSPGPTGPTPAKDGWITCWINPRSDGEGDLGRVYQKIVGGAGHYLQCRNEADGLIRLRFVHSWDGTNGIWETTAANIPLNILII